MFFIIGAAVVILCVIGGYAAMGGKLYVLWQPWEVVIICGAAVGAYIIGNPKAVILKTGQSLKDMMGGSPYTKENYLELLTLQYAIFKLAKSKGPLALEKHIDNPHESTLFSHFPHVSEQHHAVEFICDYLRLMTLGGDNPHQIEDLMNEELDVHHEEREQQASAIQHMADAMPALGIVAAVLGVIKTMGAISEPPEVLGKLIGGALVGTFLGVFVSYGFLAPIATSMKAVYEEEGKYYQCIKAGILAFLNGYAPAICVEFARKALMSEVRPTFVEVEEAVQEVPAIE